MKKEILIVVGITILFLGTCITPTIAFNTIKYEHKNDKNSNDDIDWWPMFHHDLNRSGYSTSTGPETNNVLWSYQAEGSIREASSAIVDNKVYFGDDSNNFYCTTADTGEEIWKIHLSENIRRCPAVENEKVYIATDTNIFCLNAANGNIIWTYSISSEYWCVRGTPTIYDGKVFIGIIGTLQNLGNLYCLDANTGKVIWISQNIGKMCPSVAVYNDRVYFGTGCDVYCLNVDTGGVIWSKYNTGFHYHVTIYDSKLYIAGFKNLYCLNLENGDIIWSYPTDSLIYSTPCTVNGLVYFAPDGGVVYCLDADSGEKIWDFNSKSYVWSSPAYADGKIYIASKSYFGKIFCLDAFTGEIIWDFNIGCGIYSSPSVANGKVYFGTCQDGELLCFGGESNNKPPYTPVKIFGPKRVKPYYKYIYNVSTFDPDGDQLYYKWNWDIYETDWMGPFNSNETVEVNITFDISLPVILSVIVKDSNHARSDWVNLKITYNRFKTRSNSLSLRFLGQFSNLFPLLERLLIIIKMI